MTCERGLFGQAAKEQPSLRRCTGSTRRRVEQRKSSVGNEVKNGGGKRCIKQRATKHGWDGLQHNSIIMSHMHTRKICVCDTCESCEGVFCSHIQSRRVPHHKMFCVPFLDHTTCCARANSFGTQSTICCHVWKNWYVHVFSCYRPRSSKIITTHFSSVANVCTTNHMSMYVCSQFGINCVSVVVFFCFAFICRFFISLLSFILVQKPLIKCFLQAPRSATRYAVLDNAPLASKQPLTAFLIHCCIVEQPH